MSTPQPLATSPSPVPLPDAQTADAPTPNSLAVLQHLHSYSKAYFHQLMQQRLHQPSRSPRVSESPVHSARASAGVPDDPRFVTEPLSTTTATQVRMVSPPSRRASLSPRVRPAIANVDSSPQPRRPSDRASRPGAAPAQAGRVQSSKLSSRARRQRNGAATSRHSNHVDALAAFGPQQLYAREDQQPLSARSQDTFDGSEAASSSSLSSSSSSSCNSLLIAGAMGESSDVARQSTSNPTRRSPSGGVADRDTLRRLISKAPSPSLAVAVPAAASAANTEGGVSATSSALRSDRRRRHRRDDAESGGGPAVRFKEPSPSNAPARDSVRSPRQSQGPVTTVAAAAYDSETPGAWMTRSGAEKAWYARLHPSTSLSSPSPSSASPPISQSQSQPQEAGAVVRTDVAARSDGAPASEAMARLTQDLDMHKAEINHLRAALVVASNHMTSSSSRPKKMDSSTARVLALASVMGSSNNNNSVDGDTSSPSSSSSPSRALCDAAQAVLDCLQATAPHASGASAGPAGRLALDQLLRGVPRVPFIKPPARSLREQLSQTLQRPLCGVMTVLLPRSVAAHSADVMNGKTHRAAQSTSKRSAERKTQRSGQVHQGDFPLSTSAPVEAPSIWSSWLDSTASVSDALTWCPCFVVADDRGVTLFRSADDYMAGAYARALLAVPYAALSCFVPDLRQYLQVGSEPARTASTVGDWDEPTARSELDNAANNTSNNNNNSTLNDSSRISEETRSKKARRGLLSRLFSKTSRAEKPGQGLDLSETAARDSHRTRQGGELAQYLVSLLWRADTTEHYFGFLPVTPRESGDGRPSPSGYHTAQTDERDRRSSSRSSSRDVPSLWHLSRHDWARCPPLLFRTASQQAREEWVHSFTQRFHAPLYLDLFPRFAENAIAFASHTTQTDSDAIEAPPGMTDSSEKAHPRPSSSASTQTTIGASVEVRDLIGGNAVASPYGPPQRVTPAITVLNGPSTTASYDESVTIGTAAAAAPASTATAASRGSQLVEVSSELRQLLDRKNTQLLAAEAAKDAAEAALHVMQQRVDELVDKTHQLQQELSAVQAGGGDRVIVDGQLREEVARLREVADRATADLARLRAKQEETKGGAHGVTGPPPPPPRISPSPSSLQRAAEEEEDMATVIRAEREIWRKEREALLDTQHRLAAEVLALRHHSSDGLRALARRAVGDLDLLHDEMMKETNSLIASTSAISPIQPVPGSGSRGPVRHRGVGIRAPPGLPRQEVADAWPSATSSLTDAMQAPAMADDPHVAEHTMAVDGDSYFSDLHYGSPSPAAAGAAVASNGAGQAHGSPGIVQSPRSALRPRATAPTTQDDIVGVSEAHQYQHQHEQASLLSTPGRQLFSTLIAPTATETSDHGLEKAALSSAGSASSSLAQLLLSFDASKRVLDGDLAVNEATTQLLSSGPTRHSQGRRWELYHHETGLMLSLTLAVDADARKRRPSGVHSGGGGDQPRRRHSHQKRGLMVPPPPREVAASEAMPWTSPHPYAGSPQPFQSTIKPAHGSASQSKSAR